MLFGAHQSVAGGLHRALALAAEDRCDAVQIFTKNGAQWREPPLDAAGVAAFRDARAAWSPAAPGAQGRGARRPARGRSAARPPGAPERRVMAHASYLINLCSDDAVQLDRSREALFCELARCDALGVDFVVFHPGARMALDEEVALDRIGESLAIVLGRAPGVRARLCIENTAGQGTTLGHRIDQIAAMIERAGPEGARLGVCIDTQHAFASGHDLRSAAGYDAFWGDLDRRVGLARLACLHLNDSKAALGQRLDRHQRIGQGEMGLLPFWRLANDPRLEAVPGVVELPPLSKDRRGYAEEVDRLRALVGAPEPGPSFRLRPVEAKPAKRVKKPRA